MFIRVDASSGVPIYRQIVDQVMVAVSTGALTRGEKLPSVRALSEAMVINPTTVQRAYLELEREAVIETRRGQGTFVRAGAVPLSDAERERRVREKLGHALAEAGRVQMDETAVRRVFEEEVERFLRRE